MLFCTPVDKFYPPVGEGCILAPVLISFPLWLYRPIEMGLIFLSMSHLSQSKLVQSLNVVFMSLYHLVVMGLNYYYT